MDQGVTQKSFGSDNHSGVHPLVLRALADANAGHVPAYGGDPVTARARDLIRASLAKPEAEVFFVFTGTAANTLAIRAACRPFEAVVATDIAHINEDECGAPEYNTGSKIIAVEHRGGKLPVSALAELEINPNDPHRVLPRLVSLTQATEMGTVYSLAEIRAICEAALAKKMFVHMDGARLSNAAIHLGCSLEELTRGVDILSFGGTKNGLLCAEAVVFLNPGLADAFPFIRKQSMQLSSKMRYLSCQFLPYLETDMWRENAANANSMARYLRSSLAERIPDTVFPYPTEANEVFVIASEPYSARIRQYGPAYLWDKPTGLLRLVCAFDTRSEDVDRLMSLVCP
jgi:threonine aldolase